MGGIFSTCRLRNGDNTSRTFSRSSDAVAVNQTWSKDAPVLLGGHRRTQESIPYQKSVMYAGTTTQLLVTQLCTSDAASDADSSSLEQGQITVFESSSGEEDMSDQAEEDLLIPTQVRLGLAELKMVLQREAERLLQVKALVLIKRGLALTFRMLDTGLDIRTAVVFFRCGDDLLGMLTLVFVCTGSLAQFLCIGFMTQQWRNALPFLIPGSFQHLYRESIQFRLLRRLSQADLFARIHEAVGGLVMNDLLIGCECLFESLPQIGVQGYALILKGGDRLMVLSLACSIIGSLAGVSLAARLLREKQTIESSTVLTFDRDTGRGLATVEFMSANGSIVTLGKKCLSKSTAKAIGWFMSMDPFINMLDLGMCVGCDAFMARLPMQNNNVKIVYLDSSDLTDAGLARLSRRCHHLSEVHLDKTSVSDFSIAELAHSCIHLSKVSLIGTNLTDVGLQMLSKWCTGIVELYFDDTAVTDVGITSLTENCKGLVRVDMDRTVVTDVGLTALAKSSAGIRILSLRGTKVSDVGLTAVAHNCPCLFTISLGETEVTAVGIRKLARCCEGLALVSFAPKCALAPEDARKLVEDHQHIKFEFEHASYPR